MITPDCSELGVPDFLIRALFHFTWRKGGDGGEVTSVSTFSDNVPYLDFSFSTISACSSFRYPERDITCGVTFFKAISWAFFRRSCHNWNKKSEVNKINLLMLYKQKKLSYFTYHPIIILTTFFKKTSCLYCWTKWCSSFEESKPFEGCWRLGCACCCLLYTSPSPRD